MTIKTSVIITNHNYGRFLGRCIRSCINQTMDRGNYEIIVVDDASKDESHQVMQSYGQEIRSIFLKKRRGVSYASNEGIKKANGLFVVRVDADDFINENMLQFMTELLVWNNNLGFIYCDHFRVDEKGEKLERVNMRHLDNLLNHGAGILFRKLNLETLGLYNKDIMNCEDMDLLVRYMRNFDGHYLPLPLYRYTQHENSLTSDKEKRMHWKRKIYKKSQIKTKGK